MAIFRDFFTTVSKVFILVGGLGTGLSFYGGLDTFLIFPNSLSS